MSKWLACKITKGMFSDERTVTVQTATGEAVSAFVPRQAVQGDHGDGRVKVRVANGTGRLLAVLPDEHQSVVDIDESQLAPA
jgi:hypothetical protein